MEEDSLDKDILLTSKGKEIEVIGNQAVKKVQDANRSEGVPNVYSIDGKVFYEVGDGKITTENPFNIIKTIPNDKVMIGDDVFSTYYDDKEINDSIAKAVLSITTKIQMSKYDTGEIVFAVMMNGGAWYASRLFNRLQNAPYAVEYVFSEKKRDGSISISSKTKKSAFKGKHVIMIEGFSNHGNMISLFEQWLEKNGAKTVDLSLLFKRESLDIDTINEPLVIGDGYYILGCGLEYMGKGRNLNIIFRRYKPQ